MRARDEGRVTVATARAELDGAVAEILSRLEVGAPVIRAIPVQLAKPDEEFPIRRRPAKDRRTKRRSARDARKVNRRPKKAKAKTRR